MLRCLDSENLIIFKSSNLIIFKSSNLKIFKSPNLFFMKIKLLAFLFAFVSVGAYAQQTIPISGGSVSGSSGTLSYSLGQMVMMSDVEPAVTVNVVTASIIEGVQQPYTIDQIAIPKVSPLQTEVVIFPNPTTKMVTVRIEDQNPNYQFFLYSNNGQQLMSGTLEQEKVLDMGRYPAGSYFLTIQDENHSQNNYRIIKVD